MNKKIIDFTSENIPKIILKKPKETARHTAEHPEYISEVWYLDGDKLYQPIIKTPRLKVKYGAKQWNSQTSSAASWNYCVGLYNYDIDPDIKHFYEAIKEYDKQIITYWTSNKKTWNIKHHTKIKAKYFTALRRRAPDEDPYFNLKLIVDKNGDVLTSINNMNREKLMPTDIGYGKHVDQYISPSCVLFNDTGIYPFWQAHQIVVSHIERVFLESCLLDNLMPTMDTSIPLPPPPPPPPQFSLPQPSTPLPAMQSQTKTPVQAHAPVFNLGRIKKEELIDALGKLKSIKPSEIPKGERNKITPEQLQKQIIHIKKRSKRNIMMDSIKNMPIEGDL